MVFTLQKVKCRLTGLLRLAVIPLTFSHVSANARFLNGQWEKRWTKAAPLGIQKGFWKRFQWTPIISVGSECQERWRVVSFKMAEIKNEKDRSEGTSEMITCFRDLSVP